MLGQQDGRRDFFNGYVEQRLLPKKHELLEIDEQIDFSFVEEEVRDLYCSDNGRPSYPPERMFRILFLEYYYNLSDVEVVKQLQVNILFRWFVGLSLEDPIPDDSSLSVFRARLREERFQRLFARLIEQCREKGLLGYQLKILDATHVVADVAVPTTINLLREGRRRVLKRIEEKRGKQEALEEFHLEERSPLHYSKEQLAEEVSKTRELIARVQETYEEAAQEIAYLKEVVKPTGKRTLVSLVDPDARFGRKSSTKSFAGYKVHVVQDSTSELITNLEVLPGNANEGEHSHTSELLKREEEQGIHHRGVVADALYDSNDNYTRARELEMTAYIPGRQENRRVKAFHYDEETEQLICPHGARSIGKVGHSQGGEIHYFSVQDCRGCTRADCKRDAKGRMRVYLGEGEKARRAIPEEAMRWALSERKKVERRFGQAKRHHRLARARYRGRWRVEIQALMTFFVIDAKRMVKLLAARPNPPSLAPG